MNPITVEAARLEVGALFAPIADELARAEEVLRGELHSRYPFVDELVKYSFRLGGKRLRPALLLLSAKACGRVADEHFILAAVVEMIHTATLVHDDVLDDADVRRHLATVNSLWTNEASVLLGDYLFTHAFYLASTTGSAWACRTIGEATNLVCEGELRQVHSRGNFALREEEYLGLIQGKTAQLCACCCRLGAHYSGATPELVESLTQYGRELGMAFQIADDLLDLWGDESAAGKSLGTDLEKQKLTLPIIRLLQQTPPDDRPTVLEILKSPSSVARDALAPWLARTDALEYAQCRAQSFAADARGRLAALPPSASRTVLEQLAEFVVARRH